MSTTDNYVGSNDISLRDLIDRLRDSFFYLTSRWMIILLISLLGGTLALTYAFTRSFIYTSSCTFVVEEGDASSKLGQYAGIASMMGVELGGAGGLFHGENIIELYKSRAMIEKALLSRINDNNEELVVDRYVELKNLKEDWIKNEKLRNFKFLPGKSSRIQDSLLGKFYLDISKNFLSVTKPDKSLSIIQVQVKSKDEIFSKSFNDQIVKNVNDFYILTKTKKSIENLSILEHQTDSVRNTLNDALYNSASIVDATPNLNPTRQVLRVSAQRSQFNAEANKAILTQLVQQLELARLALRKETPLIQLIDVPVFPLEREKLGNVKAFILGCMIFGILFSSFLLLTRKKEG